MRVYFKDGKSAETLYPYFDLESIQLHTIVCFFHSSKDISITLSAKRRHLKQNGV